MKRLFCAAAGLILCFAPRGSATEAIYNFGTFQNIAGFALGAAGFGFSPTSDIQVTSLGFAQNADIAINPYTVSLWDSTGDLLASAQVTSGNPTFNQSYYAAVTPVILHAGGVYFIGAGETAVGLWAGNVNNVGDFSVTPEITYLGNATGANIWQGLQANSSSLLLVGPDFQYAVATPEPPPAAFVAPFLLVFAFKALPRRALKNC